MKKHSDSQRSIAHTVHVAVLIPCFNEDLTVASVIASFRKSLPDASIYVYDNNSTDATRERALAAGATVRSEPRQGKGNVVRRMFSEVTADYYILVDGDGTYDAALAPLMLQKMVEERLDMLNAARVENDVGAYRRSHKLGNRLLTGTVSFFFGKVFDDMLSGYKIFSRRYVKSFPAFSHGFEIETELTVHALELGMPCGEMQSTYGSRPPGSVSKLKTIPDGLRILRLIGQLVKDERPLLFFSVIGFVFFFSGIILGLPVLFYYSQFGTVPRLPTAILSSSLVVLSVILVVAGLILEQVANSRKEMKRLFYLLAASSDEVGSSYNRWRESESVNERMGGLKS